MLTGPAHAVRAARRLHKEMSLPEVLPWKVLRTRPLGMKFRRQQPAGRHVLDFYCHEHRLAVEADGEVHGYGDRPARDEARDEALSAFGVTTLRSPRKMVFEDCESVVNFIASSSTAAPLHRRPAAGGSPPLEGEDVPLGRLRSH